MKLMILEVYEYLFYIITKGNFFVFKNMCALVLFLNVGNAWCFSSNQALREQSNSLENKLSKTLIIDLEKRLLLPNRAHALGSYTRHYAYKKIKNVEYVFAVFVFKRDVPGQIKITSFKKLPIIFDGGCDVIELSYSLSSNRIESLFCHGDA